MVSERLGITIFAMLACLAVAQRAAAQTGARAPLFGPDSDRKNLFDLTFALQGGYDDSVAFERLEALDPRIQLGGYYGSLESALDFARQGRRVGFKASAGASLQQFEKRDELSGFSGPAGFASVQVNAQVASRTSLAFGQSFSSFPYFGFDAPLAPGLDTERLVLTSDRAVLRRRTYSGVSSATLSHALTRRSSLELDYSLFLMNIAEPSLGESYHSLAHHAGVQFTRELRANLAMRLGYGYNQAPVSLVSGRYLGTSHDIDVGIDYQRPFRLARRTTFEFGLGSNVLNRRDSSVVDDPRDATRSTLLGLVGRARLNHQFRAPWIASASYDRGVQYSQAFGAPVFSDTVDLSLSGHLGRRLFLSTSVTYLNGGVGFGNRNDFDTLGTTVQLQFGLTRHLALTNEYHYYHYQIGDDVGLVRGFARNLGRRGARLGLTAWLPLFGR